MCSEVTEVRQREGTPHARGTHSRNSKDENPDDVGGVLVLKIYSDEP